MNDRHHHIQTNDPMPWRELLAVGFAALGPPLAWGLHLNLSYFLVQPVCVMGGEMAMHAGSVGALFIALAALGTSIRMLASNPVPFRENVDGFDGWKAFVGLYGIASGLLFSLAIVTQWVPMFVIEACG